MIYVSDYDAPFDSNEEFLNAVLNEVEFMDFSLFSSYVETIESERQQILDDIQDIGLYEGEFEDEAYVFRRRFYAINSMKAHWFEPSFFVT